MDHVGLVVQDMAASIAFFRAIGLVLEGEMAVGGEWVDRIIGLEGTQSEIAMLRTPDGHNGLELSRFVSPQVVVQAPAPSNTTGLRHVAFEVSDLDEVLARLRPLGAELVGEVVRYEDIYRLCYVRGPEGILVELAEPLG
jgi:catechol 2,3-dioxygenase-like lactoylglutathione lyase family enzyme